MKIWVNYSSSDIDTKLSNVSLIASALFYLLLVEARIYVM